MFGMALSGFDCKTRVWALASKNPNFLEFFFAQNDFERDSGQLVVDRWSPTAGFSEGICG
jgi:hypothetical protein